jgi:hypothetical protein
MKSRTLAMMGVVLLAGLIGCATTVRVPLIDLPEANVSGLARVIVFDFSGEAEEARRATVEFADRLEGGEFFQIVTIDDWKPTYASVSRTVFEPREAILETARRMQLDGVFFGEVQAESKLDEDGWSVGPLRGNVEIVATAKYIISAELIDLRGQRRPLTQRASRNYTHRAESLDSKALKDPHKMLDRFRQECLDELAAYFLPKRPQVELPLGQPSWFDPASESIKKGNELAELGEWAKAIERYEQALAATPGNAAAKYNLALALTAVGRYDESATILGELNRQSPGNGDYQKALAQVRTAVDRNIVVQQERLARLGSESAPAMQGHPPVEDVRPPQPVQPLPQARPQPQARPFPPIQTPENQQPQFWNGTPPMNSPPGPALAPPLSAPQPWSQPQTQPVAPPMTESPPRW